MKKLLIILIFIPFLSKAQYLVPDYVRNYDQTKPTVYAVDLGGGYQQVADSAAKADLSSDKRAVGMMVSYKKGSNWTTARYDGVDVLNINWVNENNWTNILESDTLFYFATRQELEDSLSNYTTLDSLDYYLPADSIRKEISDSINSYNFPSFGTSGQVPYMNVAGSDFVYSPDVYINTAGEVLYAQEIETTGINRTIFPGNSNGIAFVGQKVVSRSEGLVNYSEAVLDTVNYYVIDKINSDTVLNVDIVNNFMTINTDTTFNKGNLRIDSSVTLKPISSTHTEGKFYYDNLTKTYTAYNDIPDFTQQMGYSLVARYYNGTGITIEKGTLLTPTGTIIDGQVIPTATLAGNSTRDSLELVAASATQTQDGEYGIVKLFGAIEKDLSGFNTNDILYASYAGEVTNIEPEPPLLSFRVGKVFYADNDSGVFYMLPGEVVYSKAPNFSADSSEASEDVIITAANEYEYLPLSVASIRKNFGYTAQGDSVQVNLTADYTIILSLSFQGNPTSETWRYGIFVNNEKKWTKSRSTTSSANGDVTVSIELRLTEGDWVSFRIKNETGTGDPTIIDMLYAIQYENE